MKVGCFALVDPFQTLDHQLARIAAMGFKYADVTDNHSGGLLGREFGFAATVSLDDNPLDVRRAFEEHGLTITSFCAHANLLDPTSPARYGTAEIIKAVKLAALMKIPHVITTEGDPKTAWGHRLTHDQRIFTITEKLHEPLRLAGDLGVTILIEPHGIVTDSIEGLHDLIAASDHVPHLGINLDTGNAWLGGADPVEMARVFKDRIQHVHWKDLPREWASKRGTMFGCGFGLISLGGGAIDIAGVYDVLKDSPHLKFSTLEVGGDENLRRSYEFLRSLGAD
jgi:inosose dehydratase